MVIQGIIRPPPEIRAVADRTALYVAKNGRNFEHRILNSAKGQTPKFAFLHNSSPFHAYYEDRIQFYEKGGGGGEQDEEKDNNDDGNNNDQKINEQDNKVQQKNELAEASSANNKKTTTTGEIKASAIDPIAKALLQQRARIAKIRRSSSEQQAASSSKTVEGSSGTEEETAASDQQKQPATVPTSISSPPPPLPLIDLVAPASLSILQLESMQWIAQLAALGKHVNFLSHLTRNEWNNPVEFGFTQPRHPHFAYFSALVDAYGKILHNWQHPDNDNVDQLVVDSNGGGGGGGGGLSACLEVAAYRAEYERDQAERAAARRLLHDEMGGGRDVMGAASKIDWHDFVVVETIDFNVDEIVTMLPPPPPPPTKAAAAASATAAADAEEETMDESDDDDEAIRVVPSYTPKVVAARDNYQMETAIDPITGKSVAVRDMPEHMRIQLLDPKWAEERKKFQDKQKESNLVSGDMVASNLERFAQARGDRFGKKEHNLLGEEKDQKKRLEEANRIIREQAQSQSTVGPTLPGLRKQPPPSSTTSSLPEQPPAKRPKVTYAPSVVQQQQQQQPLPLPPVTVAPVPPPPPPAPEDPFAAAATAALSNQKPAATKELVSESDFVASLGEKLDVGLQIRVPNDSSQMAWNFYGQIVSISVDVMSKVKAVKEELSSKHLNSLPANKIQLKNVATGAFLKDAMTLAALNVGPGSTLELVPRARGGKKK